MVTLKAVHTKIRELAKLYKIKLLFLAKRHSKDQHALGWYNLGPPPEITIIKTQKIEQLASTFFHELQHHINHLEGREYRYNSYSYVDLAEELYTDRRAELLQRCYFPLLRFNFGYQDKTFKRILKEEFDGLFKDTRSAFRYKPQHLFWQSQLKINQLADKAVLTLACEDLWKNDDDLLHRMREGVPLWRWDDSLLSTLVDTGPISYG